VGHPDRIKFAVLPDETTGKYLARNVVYREVLTGEIPASMNVCFDAECDAGYTTDNDLPKSACEHDSDDGEWLDPNEARSESDGEGYESDFVVADGTDDEDTGDRAHDMPESAYCWECDSDDNSPVVHRGKRWKRKHVCPC
jgi:hypothetical protein